MSVHAKEYVLGRFLGAIAVEDPSPLAYSRWVVRVSQGELVLLVLGGGPTEAEAWHNARVHIETKERWDCRGGDKGQTVRSRIIGTLDCLDQS
jgi:hypothetical protein